MRYNVNQRLPATFEIIYGHAWQAPSINITATPDEVAIPIHLITRRR